MSLELLYKQRLLEICVEAAEQLFRDLDQIFTIPEESNQTAVIAKVLTFENFTIARNPRTSFYYFYFEHLHYRLFQDGRVQQLKDSGNTSFSEVIDLYSYNETAYLFIVGELAKVIAQNTKQVQERLDTANNRANRVLY